MSDSELLAIVFLAREAQEDYLRNSPSSDKLARINALEKQFKEEVSRRRNSRGDVFGVPYAPEILKIRDSIGDQILEISINVEEIKRHFGPRAVRSSHGTILSPSGIFTVTHLRDRGQFFPEEDAKE